MNAQWGVQIGPTDWIYTRRGEPLTREDAELMIEQRGNRQGERLVVRYITDWQEA